MKAFLFIFLLFVLNSHESDNESNNRIGNNQETSNDESEEDEIHFSSIWEIPPTRALFPQTPTGILKNGTISIEFENSTSFQNISIIKETNREIIYLMQYNDMHCINIDISEIPNGDYIILIETEIGLYEGRVTL